MPGKAYNSVRMPTQTDQPSLPLTGSQLIAGHEAEGQDQKVPALQASDPATGRPLPGSFAHPSAEQIEQACHLADQAAAPYRETTPEQRAQFLEAIAEELEALGDPLIERAMAETGLPRPRLEGERARTANQFRLFAGVLRAGRFLRLTEDTPLPDRKPLPRPSLRTMRVAVGPVVVFGASNFPLAYSVAGGDTASALAAGCPVIARAHPAHPGTGELAGRAIQKAQARTGMPAGVFSMLTGSGNALGEALVKHPAVAGVGFTGSRKGGLALQTLAQARPVPIPVFAEMSSINPVFVLQSALEKRGEAIAQGFGASVTLGVGQFCTNPGLVIGIASPEWDRFEQAAAAAVKASTGAVMLHAGIAAAYQKGVEELRAIQGVELLAEGSVPENSVGRCGRPLLSVTTAAQFLADKRLSEEHFGPSSLLVRCTSKEEMLAVAHSLEGQLTCTLQLEAEDHAIAQSLVSILTTKAGRLIANGFPTGVEVGHAMVHGGPFPATTDSRWTSVGAAAIDRWLRPVCFQDFPAELLPIPLRSASKDFPVETDGIVRDTSKEP